MPEYEDAYNELIAEARRAYLNDLRPELVERLYLEYADTIDELVAQLSEGQITEARAAQLSNSMMAEMEDLADRLDQQFIRMQDRAMQLAAQGHAQGLAAAREVAGVSISHSFADVPARAVRFMMARRDLGLSSRFKTLLNRNIESMAPEIDRALSQAVQKGMSAPDLAEDLTKIMADDPAVSDALQRVRINPKTREIVPRLGTSPEFLDTDDYKRAKKLLFDNYRIAVTENNTAYFEADRVAATESPVVDLVEWQVSGRHFGLRSSPDVCTLYLQQDLHGYGSGVYHPASVPALPHPFCGCSTTKKLLRPSEWGRGPRDLYDQGDLQEVSEDQAAATFEIAAQKVRQRGGTPRTLTQNHINRQVQEANKHLRQADEIARANAAVQ